MTDSPANADDFVEFATRFLKKYSHLFTIFGIFGAISVYLSTITAELTAYYLNITLSAGTFSSLLLFVLIGFLINECFKDEYVEFSGSIPLYPQRENAIPALSLCLFDGLLASVFFMVIAVLHQSWPILLSLIFGGLLFYATVFVPPYFASQMENYEQLPIENTLYSATMSIILLYLVALGILTRFVYPNLSPDYYHLIYTIMLSIGGSLFLMLYFSLRYEVGTPWS